MRKRELQEQLIHAVDRLGQEIDNSFYFRERLAELELALEDVGWDRLGGETGKELTRDAIRKISGMALLRYLKNPLINHGVEVQGHYVFAQGVAIDGESEDVDKVWKLFWNDPANRAEFTTPIALFQKEIDLQIEGNLFLPLFTSKVNGAVRIRSIPSNEIVDIITNPEDDKEPWFYRRRWQERRMTEEAWAGAKQREAYYPAWNYRPRGRPPTMFNHPVHWDAPVYHVKVGGTSSMRFGVPEVYCSLDWATAVKKAMEDYATVRSTHARFASALEVKGGKAGVAAAKAKLTSTFGDADASEETRPSPVAGSTFIGSEGYMLNILRTGGAQSAPEEARYLFLMAGMGMGLPYSILTGDADKSNLATAKSLDRPTELRMLMRQMLWSTVIRDIATYVVIASVRAVSGVLKGKMVADEWGTERVVLQGGTKDEPIQTGVTVTFPSILEHDTDAAIKALVSAFTLDGKTDAGLFSEPVQIRELASVLGIEDVDALVDEYIKKAEEAPEAEPTEQEVGFVEALKAMKEILEEQTDESVQV